MGVLGAKFVKTKVTWHIHQRYHKKRKINRSFGCNGKCLIYLLNCKTCGKLYTYKTTNHFRSRRNNYKSEVRKVVSGNMENVKQKFLQSHFLQPDHKDFFKTVEVRLIDKTQGCDPTKWEFTGLELSKLCHLMVWILRVTISNVYVFTSTLGLVNRCWELINIVTYYYCYYCCYYYHYHLIIIIIIIIINKTM